MTSLLVINGPNLNLLGTRQPEVYGGDTLSDVESLCRATAAEVGCDVSFYQSNHEGELVDALQAAVGQNDGIVLNAGAYSHTSIAIHDAIASIDVPTVEVHVSNIHAREAFRHKSLITPAALGIVSGFGITSYALGIRAVMAHLGDRK
ncbi:MAG: type II 3-dehydroquinate dehydratase [Boseongicola sp.]